jgi:hypothetical protein
MSNPNPKILYKYKSINDYTKKLLIDNELYFSFPQDFNDPFDCFIVSDYWGDEDEWNRFLDRINPPPESRARIEIMLKELNYDKELIRDKLPETIRSNENKFALLYPLTTKNDNILMWAHYANEHKGICLGFKTLDVDSKIYLEAGENIPIGEINDNKYIPIWKVNYDKLPEPYNGIKQPPSETVKFLKTKAKDWEYEDEYRCSLFYPDIGKQNIKFAKNILNELIFGLRTSDSDKNEIIKTVKDNYIDKGTDVKIKQAVQCQTDYKILIEDLKV